MSKIYDPHAIYLWCLKSCKFEKKNFRAILGKKMLNFICNLNQLAKYESKGRQYIKNYRLFLFSWVKKNFKFTITETIYLFSNIHTKKNPGMFIFP